MERFHAENDRYWLLDHALEDMAGDYISSPEFDNNQSPLLTHVGILDINKTIDALGSEAHAKISELYSLGGSWPMYTFRLEIEQEMARRLQKERQFDAIDKTGVVEPSWVEWRTLNHLQNSFYPVVSDGFIGRLANTELWSRLQGVPQLGWDKDYPLTNEHSRGSHSLFAAVNMARVLQALQDSSPDRLSRRLREDFMEEGLLDGDEDDQEVLLLATDLAVLLGMTHDIYTPAGGDMMKHIVGLDEESEIERLLKSGQAEPEAEFLKVLQDRGLESRHIRFIVDCVQGRSASLVGQMIHSEEGDILEQDRLAYTMQDLFSAGIVDAALPKRLFKESHLENEAALVEYYHHARRILKDPTTSPIGPLRTQSRRPSLTMLDATDDYILDENLSLVCTRPDKLIWLASLRVMMSAEYYQGAKLRGQEHDFSQRVRQLQAGGKLDGLLSHENVLRYTNRDLDRGLEEINDQEMSALLRDLRTITYRHMYESRLVDDCSIYDDTWLKLPIKINPGLDTRVALGDEVISLGEYARLHEGSVAVELLSRVLEEYDGKTRVVRRVS